MNRREKRNSDIFLEQVNSSKYEAKLFMIIISFAETAQFFKVEIFRKSTLWMN